MSAVLTKKPGGDYATQLTFPAVFAAQAKASNLASQFYPDAQSRPMVIPRGSGLQEDYHEQKRLDANRRCLNGVRDNAASMARFLSSHANYIVPKPVLGQRKYANPSNGNQADIYSSRPVFRLSGGVLRTKEGQEYGLKKLKERVPQLDAIKAAKEAFITGMSMGAVGAESVGITDITTKVELYGLLSRVESDVEQGTVDSKTVNMSQSLLKLMFGFVPYADTREVEEVMESVEYIKKALDGISEQGEEGVAEQSKAGDALMRNAEYLSGLFDKMRQYLVRMNGVLNRPRKEREKASAVFIKSLGFSELEKKLPVIGAKVRREIEALEAANPNTDPDGEEAAEDAVVDDDGKYDDDDDEDEDGSSGPSYTTSSGLSSFPSVREAPAPAPRSGKDEADPKFDKENRDELARRSGTFFGKAAPEDPAIRSTGSESAEMPVLPEETEESIARRSGLLSAEAAVSAPEVRKVKRPANLGPTVSPDLTDSEKEYLRVNVIQITKNPASYPPALVKAAEDGRLDKDSFKPENIDQTAALFNDIGLFRKRVGTKYFKDQHEWRVRGLVNVLDLGRKQQEHQESLARKQAFDEAQKKKPVMGV
jgi:hypothetical protein